MKFTTALLLAAVIVGALFRSWHAGDSLWVDELHSSWVVSGSLTEVAERAAIGNQSPLYFWLLWFFARLPLPAEVALRLPGLLAGGALPVAVYWLAKRFASDSGKQDETVPLLAAWLAVVDPLAIFYSQEARPYAILQLTAIVHFGVLLGLFERITWQRRALWIITGALLVHWHYTGGLVLIAEFIALAMLAVIPFLSRKDELDVRPRNEILDLMLHCRLDLVILLAFLLPAVPGIREVAARRENWDHFVKPQPAWVMLRLFTWTPAILLLVALNHRREALSQRALVLLTCWLLIPLAIAWSTTQTHIAALFHKRYLVAAWPASLLAAAFCVRLSRQAVTQSAVVGILLAIGVASSGLIQTWLRTGKLSTERREEWRAAVQTLNAKMAIEAAPVLLRSGLIEADQLAYNDDPLFREYCLCPVRGAYELNSNDVHPLTTTDSGRLSSVMRDRLRGATSIWLLVRSSPAYDRAKLLTDLKVSIPDEQIWIADPPIEFGNVYLQKVQLHE